MSAEQIPELKRALTEAKADEVYAAKLMLRFRDTLSNVKDGLEDEGDRIYFGSTNDADQLREIIDEVEELAWDRIMASSRKKPDLYADLRELRASLAVAVAERDEHLRLKNELVLKAYPAMDQRDELLEALMDIAVLSESGSKADKIARAAIAKAKAESQT